MHRTITFTIPAGDGSPSSSTVEVKQLALGGDLWRVRVRSDRRAADGPEWVAYTAAIQVRPDAHELDLVRVALTAALPAHSVGAVVE